MAVKRLVVIGAASGGIDALRTRAGSPFAPRVADPAQREVQVEVQERGHSEDAAALTQQIASARADTGHARKVVGERNHLLAWTPVTARRT